MVPPLCQPIADAFLKRRDSPCTIRWLPLSSVNCVAKIVEDFHDNFLRPADILGARVQVSSRST